MTHCLELAKLSSNIAELYPEGSVFRLLIFRKPESLVFSARQINRYVNLSITNSLSIGATAIFLDYIGQRSEVEVQPENNLRSRVFS